jgi:hypothetical protein
MLGICGGLKALICQTYPFAMWTHCMIHKLAVASKYLSPQLEEVAQIITNVVNSLKSSGNYMAQLSQQSVTLYFVWFSL